MIWTFWHKNLWRCSTIGLFSSNGPHKPSAHFPHAFDWSKVFSGNKTWHSFHASLPPIVVIYKIKKISKIICARFPLLIAHLPCYKMLWTNPISTLKLVHENSTTNIERYALKTTLSFAWKVEGLKSSDTTIKVHMVYMF